MCLKREINILYYLVVILLCKFAELRQRGNRQGGKEGRKWEYKLVNY